MPTAPRLAPLALALLALAQCGPVPRSAPPLVAPRRPASARVPLSPQCVGAALAGPRMSARESEQFLAQFPGSGEWITDARAGRVWWPNPDPLGVFVPYVTHGQWQRTEQGWSWQSDLPWGRVTFHYGRWFRREGVWVWTPGAQFAPAWVDWITLGEGQGACWASLPPPNEPREAWYYCCQRDGLDECRNAAHPQLSSINVASAVPQWLAPAFAEDGELLPRGPGFSPAISLGAGPQEGAPWEGAGPAPSTSQRALNTVLAPPVPCAQGLDARTVGLAAAALPGPLVPITESHTQIALSWTRGEGQPFLVTRPGRRTPAAYDRGRGAVSDPAVLSLDPPTLVLGH